MSKRRYEITGVPNPVIATALDEAVQAGVKQFEIEYGLDGKLKVQIFEGLIGLGQEAFENTEDKFVPPASNRAVRQADYTRRKELDELELIDLLV